MNQYHQTGDHRWRRLTPHSRKRDRNSGNHAVSVTNVTLTGGSTSVPSTATPNGSGIV
ncbi:MAG: hypothetical protein RLZ19_1116 [Actinomycetota bacterium]